MFIKRAEDVTLESAYKGVGIRWLTRPQEGAPNFAMRLIEFEPGVVFTPHQHSYEHEIYVVEGEGMVTNSEGDVDVMQPGKFFLIMPNEIHGYRNTGTQTLKFICVIPNPTEE